MQPYLLQTVKQAMQIGISHIAKLFSSYGLLANHNQTMVLCKK